MANCVYCHQEVANERPDLDITVHDACRELWHQRVREQKCVHCGDGLGAAEIGVMVVRHERCQGGTYLGYAG